MLHNNNKAYRAITLFLWLCGLFTAETLVAKEQIKIASGEWAPIVGERLPKHGAAAVVINEAFQRAGMVTAWKFYPWQRSYLYVTKGRAHASAIWAKTPKREKHMVFSEPVLETTNVFFHLKSKNFQWNSFADVEKKRIAISKGYSYGPGFDALVEGNRIRPVYVLSGLHGMQKLLGGQAELVVVNFYVGQHIVHNRLLPEDRSKVVYHSKPIHDGSWSLAFSKKKKGNDKIIASFNRALRQLKNEGFIDRVYKDASKGLYSKLKGNAKNN
ncbi:substrate-binding periplasmic protein [Algicola sagamiensis]|uniref:substrate-binding periplasmic protein n=1 Tax=Algicola sagamiensis TaxID=163869 RepID=UPI000360BA27|nr:transporter substrate-binding domain-containing protein [Algicola sagamiensis]